MIQAGVLNVLVTASTGQANAALRRTETQMRGTAATASTTAAGTSAAWRRVGIGLGLIGAAAGKLAIDFDHAMTQIETQAGAPQGEIQKLRGQVLELAKASIFSPEQLANALYHVESVGFRGAKAIKVLNAAQKAATVGNSDLESTTYALVSALETGIKGTKHLGDAIGTLDAIVGAGDMRMEDLTAALSTGILPAAKTVGLSLTDVGAALDVMTARGTPAQAAATRLRMTFAMMGAPTDEAAKALKDVGLARDDLAKAMRDQGLPGAIQLLADHLDRVSKIQAGQVITRAFGGGRSSAAIMTLVQNADDLRKRFKFVTDQTDEFGRKLDTARNTAMNRMKASLSTMQVALIDLGTALEDPAATAMGVLATSIDKVVHTALALPPVFGEWAKIMGGAAIAMWGIVKVGTPMVGMIMGIVRAMAAMRAAFLITAEAEGLLAGATAALSVAWAASPFGVVLGGIALLTGAYLGLKAVLGSTGDAAKHMSKRQVLLSETSDNARKAIKKQNDAVSGLKSSSKRVTEAHDRERRASQHVHQAEERLRRLRERYPDSARPVLRAEADLRQAKIKEARATERVQRAEHLNQRMKHATRQAIMNTADAEEHQIDQLRQQRRHLLRLVAGEGKRVLSSDQVIKKNKQLENTEKQLDRAQKDRNQTIKKARDLFGPKFANLIDKMSDNIDKSTKATVRQGRALTRQAIPAWLDANQAGKKYNITLDNTQIAIMRQILPALDKQQGGLHQSGRGADDAGKKMKQFKSTSVGAFGDINDSFLNIGGKFGITAKDYGTKQRKRTGGFVVGGAGAGDRVPVNLLLEPGETGFILNKHATSELAALKEANSMYPRAKMAGGGIVPMPGFPGERINKRVIPAAQALINRFRLFLTDAYGSGHASVEHTKYGTAADFIPGRGGSWPLVDNAVRYSVQAGYTPVGYDGRFGSERWPGHGPPSVAGANAHAHITFLTAAEYLAGMMPGGARREFIKKIMITGPRGGLRTLAQAAEEALRKAANRKLAQMMPGPEAGDYKGSASGINSAAEFIPFWNRLNPRVKWAANAFSKIVPRESGWNPRASNGTHFGWYQFDAPTWSDFGQGPVSNAFNPVAATIAAGNVAEREGRGGIMSRWAATFSGWKRGGLVKAEKIMDALKKRKRGTGRLDERIDIAQRVAEMASSPSGTDLSASEVAEQIDLQTKLMKSLKDELRVARRGAHVTDRLLEGIKGKDPRSEALRKKIDNLHDRRKKIVQHQQGRKNPSMNATNAIDKDIEKVQKQLQKHRDELSKDKDKIKTLKRTFHETVTDMQGLTGKGGRIFDTKLALDELRHAVGATGLTGLTIAQLVDFATAMRYGAFQHQMPQFHKGGIAVPGRAGQQEMGAIVQRNEGIFTPRQMEALSSKGGDTIVYIEFADGMGWLKDYMRAQIKSNDRNVEIRHRQRSLA